MDNKELIIIAYSIGADLNNVGMVVSALQEGIEIGKQEAIDKACEAHCFLCEYYNDCLVAGKGFRCNDTDYIREQMEE